jgi:hypothetical protein
MCRKNNILKYINKKTSAENFAKVMMRKKWLHPEVKNGENRKITHGYGDSLQRKGGG